MILIDTAEPADIEHLLKTCIPVQRKSLNQNRMADYYWAGADGKTTQVCRVQAGELLGNIDSQELELHRYYNSADENYLFIEGIIAQFPLGKQAFRRKSPNARASVRLYDDGKPGLFAHKVTDKGFITEAHKYNTSYSFYAAWKYRLTKCGVSIIETINSLDTASLLVAAYKSDQKPTHGTLTRYIKPKIAVADFNPHVLTLMGIEGAGLGEEIAEME